MTRVPLVRFLLAYIDGADLGRIPYPYLMAQPLDQIKKPMAVSGGLEPGQRRLTQLPVEPLCLNRRYDSTSALAPLPSPGRTSLFVESWGGNRIL